MTEEEEDISIISQYSGNTTEVTVLGSCGVEIESENTSSASTKVKVHHDRAISYSLKVMNSSRKSEYTLYKFSGQKFSTVTSAKKHISDFLKSELTTFGYIIPGHGLKGKQVIKENCDLETMYAIYFGKREIKLWCTGELNEQTMSRKRAHENEENSDVSTTDMPKTKTAKRMEEVNDIMDKLKEKHKTVFSVEKLSAWAHMIHMGKHQSYENPPNLPYFGKQKKTVDPETNISPGTFSTTDNSISPGKRIQYRSECMDQLSKWHSLLERGIISQDQYGALQGSILEDITKL